MTRERERERERERMCATVFDCMWTEKIIGNDDYARCIILPFSFTFSTEHLEHICLSLFVEIRRNINNEHIVWLHDGNPLSWLHLYSPLWDCQPSITRTFPRHFQNLIKTTRLTFVNWNLLTKIFQNTTQVGFLH